MRVEVQVPNHQPIKAKSTGIQAMGPHKVGVRLLFLFGIKLIWAKSARMEAKCPQKLR